MRKRYQGNLEHRETDLVETLPPPRRANRLALTATPVPPMVEASSTSIGEPPLAVWTISAVVPPSATCSGLMEVVEDSKDGIISEVRRAIAKRKAILAMGETSTDAFNMRRRVQSRRNFTRLLNSISFTPEVVFMIPDNDV